MKLGSETASVNNWIASRSVKDQPEPTVGMGATILAYTDRYAGTIVEVIKCGRTVVVAVQEDNAERSDDNGMSECQSYTYTPNPEVRKQYFKRAPNGIWYGVKRSERGTFKKEGGGLQIGVRNKYHDFGE